MHRAGFVKKMQPGIKLHAQTAHHENGQSHAHEVFAHHFRLPRKGEEMAPSAFCYVLHSKNIPWGTLRMEANTPKAVVVSITEENITGDPCGESMYFCLHIKKEAVIYSETVKKRLRIEKQLSRGGA